MHPLGWMIERLEVFKSRSTAKPSLSKEFSSGEKELTSSCLNTTLHKCVDVPMPGAREVWLSLKHSTPLPIYPAFVQLYHGGLPLRIMGYVPYRATDHW